MRINESNFDITVSQYDYGIAIHFECGEGFESGDVIAFCFAGDTINDKEYPVSGDGDSFDFFLTEEEAAAIIPMKIFGHIDIPYSIKQFRNGEFLSSLENEVGESLFTLRIEGTVRYGNTQSE